MSDHTRTRSMQNPAIASVKRRHTGPFLPCPKAKRMALMDQKDSKHDNQNSKTTLEDCVDFAVESSKADNVVSTEESVQVIESGSENGDSPQELVEDNEDVIEQIVVDADPNENDVDEEEIVMMEINNHRNDVVLINDDILMIDEPRMVTPPPTPPPPPPPQPITIPSTRSSPQAQENCACPHQIVVGPTKLDLHQLSPQVVLKKSKKVERFLQRQQEAENIIKFRTYKVHSYELRHFQIVLTDYYQEQSIQNSKNIDTSPDNRYSTSSASKAQQDGFSTPTKEIINSVKSTEGNVNTPEFMARYEDCVAEKLLTLRKRLDTPDKPNSPIPNRLNIEGQQATNSSSIVTPLNIDIDTNKQPIHPRTRLRLSPVKKSPTSSSLKYVLRKSVVENYVEVSDSDSDSQCSVMTVSDIEYTSSGKKVIRVKEEYVELSDDTELEELEKSMKIEKEVEEDVDSDDDEARDGDNEGEDDSSSMTSHDDDGSSSTSPDEENNYINTSSVKTENVKTEIKEEVVDSEPSSQVESSLFVGDEESMDNLLDAYHKVKRKQSLNRSFPTVGKSPVKPSLIPLVKKSPVRKYKSFLGSNLSARYQQDTDTDTDTSIIRKLKQRKIKPLTIKLVNLSKETIENVIHLCSSTADWRDDELLEKAGLSSYDITRLGIVTATRQSTNYGLRQFVKKKKIFEVFLPPEKPKPLSKKQEPKIKINRKELKKLKRKQLMKEKQEAKQKEKESIRRALLKINNRFINQNKFWAFIDGGSSENHPILL